MASQPKANVLKRTAQSVDPIVVFLGVGVFIGVITIALALVASAAITLVFVANALLVYALLIAVRVSTGRLIMSQHSISAASHDQAMEKVRKRLYTDLNERLDADDTKANERLTSLRSDLLARLEAIGQLYQDELATLRNELASTVQDVSRKVVENMTALRSLQGSLRSLETEIESGIKRHSELLGSNDRAMKTRLSQVREDLELHSRAVPQELADQLSPLGSSIRDAVSGTRTELNMALRDILKQTVEIIPSIDSQVDHVTSRLEVELAASVEQVVKSTTEKSRKLEKQLAQVQSGLEIELAASAKQVADSTAEESRKLEEQLAQVQSGLEIELAASAKKVADGTAEESRELAEQLTQVQSGLEVELAASAKKVADSTAEKSRELEDQLTQVQSGLEVELAASTKQGVDNTTRKSRKLEEQLAGVQSSLTDSTREFTGHWANTTERLDVLGEEIKTTLSSSTTTLQEQVAEASAGLAARLAAFDSEIEDLQKSYSTSSAELQTTLRSDVNAIKGVLTNGHENGAPGLLDTLERGRTDVSTLIAELTAFAQVQREIARVFPRTIRMHTFVKPGALFEITTVMEEIRVERYGNEKEFTQMILEDLRDSDVFFDIGSSVGLVTINAAYKGVETYTFEPDPKNRARLERNVEINDLKNVSVIDWAVSDTAGEVTIYTDGLNGNSPSLTLRGERGSVTVRADSIDAAIARGELKSPTVIKIDIEGAEGLAIAGMRDLLSSEDAPRAIFIEIHTDFLPSFGTTHDEVTNLIESFGYQKVFEQDRMEQTHYIYRHE